MTTEDILKRIDELINIGNKLLSTVTYDDDGLGYNLDHGKYIGLSRIRNARITAFRLAR